MTPPPSPTPPPSGTSHPRSSGLSDDGHAVVRVTAAVPPEAVWDVLADGWLYATWVVGASRLRDVDETWPAPGSRLHHSFGIWPALVDDVSEVLRAEPGHRLVLQAKGWPAGEATVDLRLKPVGDGHCEMTILEDASNGPGVLVPRVLRQLAIRVRNQEALERLRMLAEGRHHP